MLKFNKPTRIRAQPRSWGRAPLLVVQVHEEIGANYDETGPTTTVKVWRDARVEDIAT